MPPNPLDAVDRLKRELDALCPLPPDTVERVAQKLRIDANYHSNAIEGNSLTLGETRSLIFYDRTARGKPMRDHIDVRGHDDAVKAVEAAVREKQEVTQAFVRELHRILLREPYEVDAHTPDGARTKRTIRVGAYKTAPNNVKTLTGETYFFTPPERVQMEMTELLDWVREREKEGEHPVILAATFHYRFVRIHPFDDGNGRMARLLMNMILTRHGYAVAIVRQDDRERYIGELERINHAGQLAGFIEFIASCCEYTLNLHLRAARGESIEDAGDIDREIALFKTMVDGIVEDNTFPIGIYAKDIIAPYYRYCESKVQSLFGVFNKMPSPSFHLQGRALDDAGFSVVDPDDSSLPEKSLDAMLHIAFVLRDFQGYGVDAQIAIQGEFGAGKQVWTFNESLSAYEGSCDGGELDELKAQFDRLLRALIGALKQYPAHKSGGGG